LILLVFSVLTSEENASIDRPITTWHYILLFYFDLLLAYDLTEKNAAMAVQRFFFNIFHIEENCNEQESVVQDSSETLQHSSCAGSSGATLTTIFSTGRNIAVAPARIDSEFTL
jgi:hypothetical protein